MNNSETIQNNDITSDIINKPNKDDKNQNNESIKEVIPKEESLKKANITKELSSKKESQPQNSFKNRLSIFEPTKKKEDFKERKSVYINKKDNKILQRFNTMVLEQEKAFTTRKRIYTKFEKINSSDVRRMQDKIKNIEHSKKEEEEKKQKEIKEKKFVDKTKMNERIDNIINDQEDAFENRRRKSLCYKIEDFNSKNVQRMHDEMKEMERSKQEEEEKKQKEIKEQKYVDKTKMNDRIDTMIKERKEKEIERVNRVKQVYSFSETTKDNYNNNLKLFQLNEKNINQIYGDKTKELSEDEKIHLFDRKINNCEIKEKISLNIALKNPNKECKYETEIYDDEGKLIIKKEIQSDKNEITLTDNSEILYKFTKPQSIKFVLIKDINSNEKIRTTMTVPLQKIISKATNDEKYEEKIENFSDNELINIDFDSPKENKEEKCVELNFNTDENENKNSNISYCIQKDDKILFKSAICNSSNIKKSDRMKLSDLEPEFEISFYNEEFQEKKVKIKTEELKNGITENINFSNIDNLKIKISSDEIESNNFIKLLKKGLNLDLSIAIDFTCSNGFPYEDDSLHKIKDGFINNYEKAIREHYKIISTYNKKDKYDVYGFGADINNEFKEIFNINGTDDPSIMGIENIIKEYKKTVNNVEFSGGTYFAPIIKKMNRKLEVNKDKNLYYHILLIISDGEICDINETIESIIEISKFPISFIIIGIGDDVTSDMKTLNGEKGKLISRNGEILNKDIVQYVHFNDYANDLNKLTTAVLKYIPEQISNYYKDKL